MLHQPTVEKLIALRLEPMADAWRALEQDENALHLTFEERLALMVDRLWTWRHNQAMARRLRYAKLRGNACVYPRCNRQVCTNACRLRPVRNPERPCPPGRLAVSPRAQLRH